MSYIWTQSYIHVSMWTKSYIHIFKYEFYLNSNYFFKTQIDIFLEKNLVERWLKV